MQEQLIIRHFGPIQEAEIKVRNLTIFMGQQATGKSIAAQLLYFWHNLSDLLIAHIKQPFDEREVLLSAMKWWFGNQLSVYAAPSTLIRWLPDESEEQQAWEIRWDDAQVHLSAALSEEIKRIKKRRDELLKSVPAENGHQNYHFYLPVGRTHYSFLPSYLLPSHNLNQIKNWPGYTRLFYSDLGLAINTLWQKQGNGRADSASEDMFLRQRIDSILKGKVLYGPETILLEVKHNGIEGENRLHPATLSGGQMEIWPFWAILEYWLGTQTSLTQLGSKCDFYFEEPESHLHPDAQRKVMEIVAYLIRQKQAHFLITTHSPYILYAINNFLMAQEVLEANGELPAEVPQEVALRAHQVAAYRFAPDGTIHDIMDAEVNLIDENELGDVADELGAAFTKLQDRLDEVE